MRKQSFSHKFAVLLLAACLVLGAAGCGSKKEAAPVSSAVSAVSSASASSAVSSTADSSASTAEQDNEITAVSSGAVSSASSAVSSAVKNIGFEKKWSTNPIDTAYKTEVAGAGSTAKLSKVYETYTEKWANEIATAYERLMTVSGSDATLKNEQTAWVDGKEQAVAALEKGKAAGDIRLKYYRDRARQVYYELYQYDPNFTFAAP